MYWVYCVFYMNTLSNNGFILHILVYSSSCNRYALTQIPPHHRVWMVDDVLPWTAPALALFKFGDVGSSSFVSYQCLLLNALILEGHTHLCNYKALNALYNCIKPGEKRPNTVYVRSFKLKFNVIFVIIS